MVDELPESQHSETIGQQPAIVPAVLTSANGEAGICFKVQVLASREQIPVSDPRFHLFTQVEEEFVNGWYKYLVGRFTDLQSATVYQSNLKHSAFADAFVVAYKHGNRISMDDARSELGLR
jgi:N-acetylmuramoyl-L-alanine amidase